METTEIVKISFNELLGCEKEEFKIKTTYWIIFVIMISFAIVIYITKECKASKKKERKDSLLDIYQWISTTGIIIMDLLLIYILCNTWINKIKD